MNVNGIGTAGYPAWYETRRADSGKKADFEEKVKAAGQKSETNSEIIVKPDGSKVLVMKISVGGMETNMSLEISKPTKAPNENSKQNISNGIPAAQNDTISAEVSNVSDQA